MRHIPVAGLAVALVWSGSSHAQQPTSAAAVRQAVAGFASTWNRHDMVAFGRLFAPGADFVNVTGSWWKGRASIQEHHAYSHGTIPKADTTTLGGRSTYWGIFRHSTMSFDSIDVRFVRPDVAIARVMWRLIGDARTAEPRTGLLLFVVVQGNDEWQIAAAQNTEIHRMVH